jgi:hypothetical protein
MICLGHFDFWICGYGFWYWCLVAFLLEQGVARNVTMEIQWLDLSPRMVEYAEGAPQICSSVHVLKRSFDTTGRCLTIAHFDFPPYRCTIKIVIHHIRGQIQRIGVSLIPILDYYIHRYIDFVCVCLLRARVEKKQIKT